MFSELGLEMELIPKGEGEQEVWIGWGQGWDLAGKAALGLPWG